MKTVGAFNADFVQVILHVNTRYSLLMDLALAELKRHFVRYIAFFSLADDTRIEIHDLSLTLTDFGN